MPLPRGGIGKEVVFLRSKILALVGLAIVACTAGAQNKTYTVRQGDTISGIADRLQVRRAELVAVNSLSNSNKVQPGQVLRVPARSVHAAVPAAPKGAAYYTVRNGDNDWTIARKHGVTLSQLKGINPSVNFSNLQIGTRIAVPSTKVVAATEKKTADVKVAVKATPAVKPVKVAAKVYKVQKNENDWIIARKFDTTIKKLRDLNPGVDTNTLQIGQSIRVPGSAAPVVASKSPSTKVASNRIRTKFAKVTGDSCIIRRGARTSSEEVARVDQGTQVAVLDYLDGWYKLRFPKGTVGWMRGDLLKSVKTIDAIRETRATSVVAKNTATKKSNVVKAPAKSSKSIVASKNKPTVVAKNNKPAKKNSIVKSSTRVAYMRPSSPTGGGRINGILSAATSRLGARYRWGSTGRGGTYDCSGFTGAVYAQNGIKLPRVSRDMAQVGKKVSKDELKAGDLVFFHTGRGSRISHVGIYKGNGQFIHASSGKGRVTVSSLNEGYYARRFSTARRVANTGKSSSSSKVASKSTKSVKKEEAKIEAAPAEGPSN